MFMDSTKSKMYLKIVIMNSKGKLVLLVLLFTTVIILRLDSLAQFPLIFYILPPSTVLPSLQPFQLQPLVPYDIFLLFTSQQTTILW